MGMTIFLVCFLGLAALTCGGLAIGKKMERKQAADAVTYLAGLALIVGLFSYTLHMFNAAKAGIITGNAFFAIITTVTNSVEQTRQVSNAFSHGSLLMMISFGVVAVCGLLWKLLKPE